MAALRCAKCGAFAPAGTSFCAFCGTPLPGGSGTSPPFAPPPATSFAQASSVPIPWGPAPGWPSSPGAPAASPATRSQERDALTYILLGAILILVSGVVSVLISVGSLVGFSTYSTTSGGLGLQVNSVFFALTFTSAFVELLIVLFAWGAFRKLAVFDRRFSTPSKLSLLLAVAIGIVIVVLYPLLTQLSSALDCIKTTSNNTAAAGCISGTLTSLILVLLLAALLAIIGYIGLLIGIWRLGSRYENGLFKAGAILTIFPVLNFIGAILILVAAHSAREALDRSGPFPTYR